MQEKLNYLFTKSCNKKATGAFPFKSSRVKMKVKVARALQKYFRSDGDCDFGYW